MTLPAPSGLAARLLAAMPKPLLQAPLDFALARALRRHPELARRLPRQDQHALLIEATDVPLAFLLRYGPGGVSAKVRGRGDVTMVEAVIRGPVTALLDLVQGDVDGDALFFSRQLAIEGDTEAVVGLRNAIDGAELDLIADLAPLPAPLVPLARAAFADLSRLLRALVRDLSWTGALVERLAPGDGSDAGAAGRRRGLTG